MPTLTLFNAQLPVPCNGFALGGLQNSVSATLSADNQSLDLQFDGELPRATLRFSCRFACTVSGNTITLTSAPAGARASAMTIGKPLSSATWTLTGGDLPPIQVVGGSEAMAFGLPADVSQHIGASVGGTKGPLVTLCWNSVSDWPQVSATFRLDAHGAHASLFIPDPAAAVRYPVEVQDGLEDGAFRRQSLVLVEMRSAVDGASLIFSPVAGALLVHGDPLDTRRPDLGRNDVLFQHALLNGHLDWTWNTPAGGAPVHTTRWRRKRGATDTPGLAVFRLHDENGHPVVLQGESFPLAHRKGLPTFVDGTKEQLEQTSQTMHVRSADDADIDGLTLSSIAPLSFDLNDKGKKEFFFVVAGRVQMRDEPPREIHGLTHGAFLRREAAASHTCRLAAKKIALLNEPAVNPYGNLFTTTEVVLTDPTGWNFVTQLEEREISPGDAVGTGEVGVRVATPVAGAKSLRLPAIDTHHACSNLVGPDQTDMPTHIASRVTDWLVELDRQFAAGTVYRDATLALPEAHIRGHQIAEPNGVAWSARFHRVLEPPPGVADTIEQTARRGAQFVPSIVHLLHGAARSQHARDVAFQQFADAWPHALVDRIATVRACWNGSAGLTQERAAMRALLGAVRTALPADANEPQLSDLYARAVDAVNSLAAIEGLGTSLRALKPKMDALKGNLAGWADYWDPRHDAPAEPLRQLLLDYVMQPATDDVFRALSAKLYDEAGKARDSVGGLAPAMVAKLQHVVGFDPTWVAPLASQANTIVTGLPQGVDPLFALLIDYWANHLPAELADLPKKYGAALTNAVYERLTELKADAQKDADRLFAKFNAYAPADLTKNIFKLADIASAPPEYLFVTKRFDIQDPRAASQRLWERVLPLCDIGKQEGPADSFWRFALTNASSAIVKLTGKRSIAEILTEIHRTYRTDARSQPLGMDLHKLLGLIDPDLQNDPSWRGVFIVLPTVDLDEDPTLRDLAGFRYVQAAYAAIGGAPTAQGTNLDVSARIYQDAPEPDAAPGGDLSLALLKFDVTITHSQLEAGEIIFLVDLQNMWGRRNDEVSRGESRRFPKVYLRGSLPSRKPKKAGATNEPRSLEFSAWFSPPVVLDVGLAFIDSVAFKAMRVARAKGQTAIAIDGELKLRPMPVGSLTTVKLFDDRESTIGLDNFRILLPSSDETAAQRIGMPRALGFDFPSISFNLKKPRILNFGGIELKPFKIGLARVQSGAIAEIRSGYMWLLDWPPAGDFDVPFVRFEVDFGKLPQFGGTNLSGMKLDFFFGIHRIDGLPGFAPIIGIGGFSAKYIKLDLFRLLTIEIRNIAFAMYKAYIDDANAPQRADVAALSAKNVSLKILDWSPLPENAELQFVFAERDNNDPGTKSTGVLAFSDLRNLNLGILKLHWLLLANNFAPDDKILDYLLGARPSAKPIDLVGKLIDEDNKRIRALLQNDGRWLFGASFEIAEIVDSCRIILYDQHYYGISIATSAPWLSLLLGVDHLALAYIEGARKDLDRFRTSFRLAFLDLLGNMRSGELAFEWGVNWDFLLDFGFPWRGSDGYDWFRAFSVPAGIFEAKFGFYFEKRHQLDARNGESLVLGAGVGMYLGLFAGFSGGIVWARVGIGVFAILEGVVEFALAAPPGMVTGVDPFHSSLRAVRVNGVIGIFAYGEGGIDVWILSARFRVQLQAACSGALNYLPGGPSSIAFDAEMSASYSASVRVGHGWFSFEFSVEGSLSIHVAGQLQLN